MIGCSGSQMDSNPRSSARSATSVIFADDCGNAMFRPICILIHSKYDYICTAGVCHNIIRLGSGRMSPRICSVVGGFTFGSKNVENLILWFMTGYVLAIDFDDYRYLYSVVNALTLM